MDTYIIRIKNILLVLVLSMISSIVLADNQQDNQKNPQQDTSLVVQAYGYAGDLAVGVDIPSDSGKFHFTTLLGIAQQQVSGKNHGVLTLKGTWHPFSVTLHKNPEGVDTKWESVYTGLSLIMFDTLFSDHDEDQVYYELPDKYPSGYYPPTAITGALNIGTSLVSGKTTLYAEVVITMQGLDAYYHNHAYFAENYDYWGLEAVSSLGIGLKMEY